MKPPVTRLLHTATIGLCLTTGAHAAFQVAFPPVPVTTWTVVADTGFPAPDKYIPGLHVTAFTDFSAPVISGGGTGFSFPPRITFKGKMTVAAPVTVADDEGIWSNGDPITWTNPLGPTTWMVAQEGDSIGGVTLGKANSMPVRALQNAFFGGTLFTTNSNLSPPLFNLSVYEGGGLNGVAGNGVGLFTGGGRAVTDGTRIAAWAQSGPIDGTRFWDINATLGSPHTLTNGIYRWLPTSNPRVPCSPAISQYGGVAHRARTTGAPWFRQNFIQAEPPKFPGGFFPAAVTVVRQNDLAQAGERFGIFHPILMAITGGANVAPTVAWQMSNLYIDTGSSATLGALIPGSKSLWCWRQLSSITPYAQIAREGAAATDITGRTFKSFYALHLVDDNTNWPDSDVFYGVILDNGNRAIYTRHITTFAGTTTTLGTEQLIATDDIGGPLLQHVPAIYGGTFPIATLFAWFSVDIQGNVLIKATLGGTVPPGQAQCLIAAMSGTSNHAMVMRAQSDPTVFSLPTLSHGPQAITGFDITNPEQGPLGRGQGISGSTIGAVINFTGANKGVYYGQ